MTKTYYIFIILFPSFLFAGGNGGGGGVRPEERTINPELILDFGRIKADPKIRIIHGIPSLNGVSRVSVGRIDNNQWQIQEFNIPSEFLINSELSQEIQKSIELNDWVEIKK